MQARSTSQKNPTLAAMAVADRQEVLLLRARLFRHRRQSEDKHRVRETLISWGWDGLKARMSQHHFSRYVGVKDSTQIGIPPAMVRSFGVANANGTGREFVEAFLARATLDGVAALWHFQTLIRANALYIAEARRAFTSWAAYKVLTVEDGFYENDIGYETPPLLARSMIPILYPLTFKIRTDWDATIRKFVFDDNWWPPDCLEPFWAAGFDRNVALAMQGRFEPHRVFTRKPPSKQGIRSRVRKTRAGAPE
jgi:hypothetical protein